MKFILIGILAVMLTVASTEAMYFNREMSKNLNDYGSSLDNQGYGAKRFQPYKKKVEWNLL